MRSSANARGRYPFRAVAGVTAAALFVLGEIAMLSMWMMPLVPLVPVFILIMFGNAFVLADVVQWAASLRESETVETRRAAETSRGAAEAGARPEPV
jgi:hypothetical protein